MLRENTLDEYTDEELCGDSVYVEDNICKVVEDKAILHVAGKLQQCVVVP